MSREGKPSAAGSLRLSSGCTGNKLLNACATTLACLGFGLWALSFVATEGYVCFTASTRDVDRYPRLAIDPVRTPDLAIDALTVKLPPVAHGPILVLLCNRSRPPYRLAIPGGYNNIGEAVDVTFTRELLEETDINLPRLVAVDRGLLSPSDGARWLHQRLNGAPSYGNGSLSVSVSTATAIEVSFFGVYANPYRDRRRHTVSVVYLTVIPPLSAHYSLVPRAMDDVKHCDFWDIEAVLKRAQTGDIAYRFAFDHRGILEDAVRVFRESMIKP